MVSIYIYIPCTDSFFFFTIQKKNVKIYFCIFSRGLKFVGKNRTARVKALADCLISNGYDVVCLQELWCEDDYVHLKRYCKQAFKHIHYFHRYVRGSNFVIIWAGSTMQTGLILVDPLGMHAF